MDTPERAVELDLRIGKHYQDAIRSDSVATFTPVGIHGDSILSVRRGLNGAVLPADAEIPFTATRQLSAADLEKMMDCLSLKKSSLTKQDQLPPSGSSKPQP
jgi:hypothetical protein